MFYKLTQIDDVCASASSGCHRFTKRDFTYDKPMFWEAFMSVQRHPSITRIAVAGFLRDDGTAVCKRLEWTADVLSLYKIVLLNLGTLKTLEVEYMKDIRKFEDIFLASEVLATGGRTLKCQKYCFRASHSKDGGCADQRGQRGEMGLLQHLIADSAFNKLASVRKQLVMDLLQWTQFNEHKFSNACTPLGRGTRMPVVSGASKPTKQESLKRPHRKPMSSDHNADVAKFRKLARQPPSRINANISAASTTTSSSSSSSTSSAMDL
jgi:hypothetical protein